METQQDNGERMTAKDAREALDIVADDQVVECRIVIEPEAA